MTTTKDFRNEVEQATRGQWKLSAQSKYTRATDKVIFIHAKCGTPLITTPKQFRQRGLRCKNCKEKFININKRSSRKAGKTTKQFEQELVEHLGTDYKLLSSYINQRFKVKVKHLVCGTEFSAYPNNLLKERYGCPHCSAVLARKKQMIGMLMFEERLKDTVGTEYTLLTPYKDMKTRVKMRHNKCGHEFTILPNKFINNNNRCPYCNASGGESLILSLLVNDFKLKENHDFYYGYILPNKLHLDFYLPQLNLAFEYDGEQHYKVVEHFGGQTYYDNLHQHDLEKDRYCKEHGIKLVRIPYTVNKIKDIKKIISYYINLQNLT